MDCTCVASPTDLLILGVSRCGKTPLSIYLGQRGYKVRPGVCASHHIHLGVLLCATVCDTPQLPSRTLLP